MRCRGIFRICEPRITASNGTRTRVAMQSLAAAVTAAGASSQRRTRIAAEEMETIPTARNTGTTDELSFRPLFKSRAPRWKIELALSI